MLESEFTSVLTAAKTGAEWAWGEIYREYSAPVLRYLRGHGARDAEDLLGEVFLQVVRNLEGFEGDERDFRSWVFMIARHRLIDVWRQGGREIVDVVPDDLLSTICGNGDAEADSMRRLTDEHVIGILRRLTPEQRDVLYLRLFARLTVVETAAVVGRRPGAVKALQARGLATIRREMLKGAVTL